MTRGLVRKNNLSDLPSAEQARVNLGLATADYNRIRGLYTSAGVSHLDVQRIAGSTGNFQLQINVLAPAASGVVFVPYVARSGDTISGVWTNTGYIQPGSLVASGVTLSGSSDSLFCAYCFRAVICAVYKHTDNEFRLDHTRIEGQWGRGTC